MKRRMLSEAPEHRCACGRPLTGRIAFCPFCGAGVVRSDRDEAQIEREAGNAQQASNAGARTVPGVIAADLAAIQGAGETPAAATTNVAAKREAPTVADETPAAPTDVAAKREVSTVADKGRLRSPEVALLFHLARNFPGISLLVIASLAAFPFSLNSELRYDRLDDLQDFLNLCKPMILNLSVESLLLSLLVAIPVGRRMETRIGTVGLLFVAALTALIGNLVEWFGTGPLLTGGLAPSAYGMLGYLLGRRFRSPQDSQQPLSIFIPLFMFLLLGLQYVEYLTFFQWDWISFERILTRAMSAEACWGGLFAGAIMGRLQSALIQRGD
jgi:membrane associated rhomboid family serine protease